MPGPGQTPVGFPFPTSFGAFQPYVTLHGKRFVLEAGHGE